MKLHKAQKQHLAWMMGYGPGAIVSNFPGESPVEPSDEEAINVILMLSPEQLQWINKGPHGEQFRNRCHAALERRALGTPKGVSSAKTLKQ